MSDSTNPAAGRGTAVVTEASSDIGAATAVRLGRNGFSVALGARRVERLAQVYEGVTPPTADDIADCVAFAVTRPSPVDIDSMIVLARDQAGAREVHRHP